MTPDSSLAPVPPPPPPRRWWVRLSSGRQFGPFERTIVEQWINDGRAGPGSLIAHEGSVSWKPLEVAFPELCRARSAARNDIYAPGKNVLAALPRKGLLGAVQDDREKFDAGLARQHQAAHDRLARDTERSALGMQFLGSKSVRLRPSLPPEPGLGPPMRPATETLLFAAFQWMEQEIYLAVPWGEMGQLPHEFFSILPVAFPSSLALRRKSEHVFDHGVWVDVTGRTDSELAFLARQSQPGLVEGTNWRWVASGSDYEMILVWGLQIVPLGARACLHILQTSMQGALRRTFGIDWYLHRQHAFSSFRDHLTVPGDHEPHFLFGGTTAQLLSRLLEM
ncbi:MAG: hypothetical protein ACR2OZ_06160 [Verrucomicrobiales bacterium]